MPKPEGSQPVEIFYGTPLLQPRYGRSQLRRGSAMGVQSRAMGRYEEIWRRLAEGRGVREIARALNSSRDTVREVHDGAREPPDPPKALSDPL